MSLLSYKKRENKQLKFIMPYYENQQRRLDRIAFLPPPKQAQIYRRIKANLCNKPVENFFLEGINLSKHWCRSAMTKADLLENQVQPNMIIPFGRPKVFF